MRQMAAEERGKDKLGTHGEAEKRELDIAALDEVRIDA